MERILEVGEVLITDYTPSDVCVIKVVSVSNDQRDAALTLAASGGFAASDHVQKDNALALRNFPAESTVTITMGETTGGAVKGGRIVNLEIHVPLKSEVIKLPPVDLSGVASAPVVIFRTNEQGFVTVEAPVAHRASDLTPVAATTRNATRLSGGPDSTSSSGPVTVIIDVSASMKMTTPLKTLGLMLQYAAGVVALIAGEDHPVTAFTSDGQRISSVTGASTLSKWSIDMLTFDQAGWKLNPGIIGPEQRIVVLSDTVPSVFVGRELPVHLITTVKPLHAFGCGVTVMDDTLVSSLQQDGAGHVLAEAVEVTRQQLVGGK